MRYDGGNPLHAAQARAKLEKLIKEKKQFDLTEKKPKRTISQNSYLHLCLAYFASQYGERAEYVKEQYYKRHVNPLTFVRHREDRLLGRVEYLRSTADLDTRELSLTLERFRTWAAQEAGIYIPEPDEERLIALCEIEIERNKEYL